MDYYYNIASPPCRAPLLTAKAVGEELNLKTVDLLVGEHKKPEFVEINPQHCVPTLVDGDLTLWESRAICAYLANKYDKSGTLYPADARKRAEVDRLLYFDMGTLYLRFSQYAYPCFFSEEKPDPAKLEKLHESLTWLEGFIQGKFVTGDHVTISDHSLVASVSTMEASGIDFSRYPKTVAWLQNCKSLLPGYGQNETGAAAFGQYAKSKLTAS